MQLILIDGGPASGKNTLGVLLIDKFHKLGDKATLLDLDNYVEEFNPEWIWENEQQKEKDQQNARINFTKDINKYLKENFIIIAIGERFLTKEDVVKFTGRVAIKCPTQLYHLSIPFALRKQRLHERGPHSLINLEKDQKERDAIKVWPGYVYGNINSPEIDAENLFKLIQDNQGLIDISVFKK